MSWDASPGCFAVGENIAIETISDRAGHVRSNVFVDEYNSYSKQKFLQLWKLRKAVGVCSLVMFSFL